MAKKANCEYSGKMENDLKRKIVNAQRPGNSAGIITEDKIESIARDNVKLMFDQEAKINFSGKEAIVNGDICDYLSLFDDLELGTKETYQVKSGTCQVKSGTCVVKSVTCHVK